MPHGLRRIPGVLPACWLAILTIIQPACGPLDTQEDEAVIVVGSTRVNADTLKKDMKFISAGMNLPDRRRGRIRDQILEQLVDHYLILEYGKKEGISLSDQEFRKALEEVKGNYTEETFNDALLRGYVDRSEWEERFREQLLVDKILQRITEEVPLPGYDDIRSYYQAHRERFKTPQMIRFRQIVTRSKEEAERILSRIHEGTSMKELAEKHSFAPEASRGGVVDWIARDQLESSMEEALFSLEPGRVSPVVKSPYGYHIFQVLETRSERVKPPSEVLHEIEAILLRERQEAFLKKRLRDLRKRFEVAVNEELLDSM